MTMDIQLREVAGLIPPEEVPGWVQGDQVWVYLGVVLATLVTYDSRKLFTRPCTLTIGAESIFSLYI